MKNYLKRLNWSGSFIMFLLCGIASISRTQDPTITESLMVWIIIGVPISILFLFVGIEPKN